MELERMGFDVTVLAFVILGNAFLVAAGAGLVAYLKRVIRMWEAKEAARTHRHSSANDYTPTGQVPVSHAPIVLKQRLNRKKVTTQPTMQAVA